MKYHTLSIWFAIVSRYIARIFPIESFYIIYLSPRNNDVVPYDVARDYIKREHGSISIDPRSCYFNFNLGLGLGSKRIYIAHTRMRFGLVEV